jgi:hypothetical protein
VAEGGDVVGRQGANVGSGFGGAVLAHWCYDGPVAEGRAADSEGCEEGWDLLAIVLVDWGSGVGCVLGYEVG